MSVGRNDFILILFLSIYYFFASLILFVFYRSKFDFYSKKYGSATWSGIINNKEVKEIRV